MDSTLVESAKLFGIEIFNLDAFLELILRFGFNILVIFIIVRLIYYPAAKRKDYLFTYFVFSAILFMICYLLASVKLQMGFALGLFAVFGIIRYRTDAIPIKEMTYLFIIIGITAINALSNKKISYTELLFTNLIMITLIYGLEKIWLLRHESCKLVEYEKISLIKPDKRKELIADLEERTGIKINRVEIGRIDLLKDSAKIMVFYYEDENRINEADEAEHRPVDDDD